MELKGFMLCLTKCLALIRSLKSLLSCLSSSSMNFLAFSMSMPPPSSSSSSSPWRRDALVGWGGGHCASTCRMEESFHAKIINFLFFLFGGKFSDLMWCCRCYTLEKYRANLFILRAILIFFFFFLGGAKIALIPPPPFFFLPWFHFSNT